MSRRLVTTFIAAAASLLAVALTTSPVAAPATTSPHLELTACCRM